MDRETTHRYTLKQWRRILARDVFQRLNMPEGHYVVTHAIEGDEIVMTLTWNLPTTTNQLPDGLKG